MSEKSDNTCIELYTIIDEADRRITDLNANALASTKTLRAARTFSFGHST